MTVPDCYPATADDDTGEAAAGLTGSAEISARCQSATEKTTPRAETTTRDGLTAKQSTPLSEQGKHSYSSRRIR